MIIGPAAGQAEGDAPHEIAEIKNVKISLTFHAVPELEDEAVRKVAEKSLGKNL